MLVRGQMFFGHQLTLVLTKEKLNNEDTKRKLMASDFNCILLSDFICFRLYRKNLRKYTELKFAMLKQHIH